MLKLLKYMKKREWVLTLLALCLILVQVALDLALPDYMEEITELVETNGSEMSEILETGAKMLLAALGSLASAVLTVLCASRAAEIFCATLRSRMFDRVQSFSGAEFDRFTTPSLINRTTGDVLQLQMAFVLVLEVMVKAPLKVVFAIVKISAGSLHWSLNIKSVIVFGRIHIANDWSDELMVEFCKRFTDDVEYIHREIENYKSKTAVLCLEIEHMTGKLVNEA